MKRDMDLVRFILMAVEEQEHGFARDVRFDGYTEEQIGYHAYIMIEGGLVEGGAPLDALRVEASHQLRVAAGAAHRRSAIVRHTIPAAGRCCRATAPQQLPVLVRGCRVHGCRLRGCRVHQRSPLLSEGVVVRGAPVRL